MKSNLPLAFIHTLHPVLSLVASILTLTVIACDRFFGIVFAMKARVTEKRSSVILLNLWILSIAISIPLLLYRHQFTRPWADHVEVWCDDDWPAVIHTIAETNESFVSYPSRKVYYTAVSLVLYFIPSGIMTVAYGIIIQNLWASRIPGEHISSMETTQHKKKKKVIIMLIAMLLVFIICWFPFQISILYPEHRDHSELPSWYSTFQFISIILADANCAFNPIIYTCFNQSFRRGFRETFRRRAAIKRDMYATSTCYNSMELRSTINHHNRINNQRHVCLHIKNQLVAPARAIKQ